MRKSDKQYEFGGPTGTKLLTISLIAVPITLYIISNENKFDSVTFNKYLEFSTYFNLPANIFNVAFMVYLSVLSMMRIGGKRVMGVKTQHGQLEYYLNSTFCFIITIILAFLGEYCMNTFEFLVQHHLHLIISSIIAGIVVSIYFYYHSFHVPKHCLNQNLHGKSEYYNFVMGREINPRLFDTFDVYTWTIKFGVINGILMALSYVVILIRTTENFQHSLTVSLYFVLFLVYLTDPIFSEAKFLTTYDIMYEGFGLMTVVGYFTYAFMCNVPIVYLVRNEIAVGGIQMILSIFLFIVGFYIFSYSNEIKNIFRNNPKSDKVKHIKTLSTTNGKLLMISGPWGIVRHPNYLGDILIQLSFIVITGVNVGSALNLFSILLLIHRTERDYVSCLKKYGQSDWKKYCTIVKYKIVPGIY